jgi:hypothetical protein
MDNVYLRFIALPHTIKGLTVQDEAGDYNIYINARLGYEANQQTLQHEVQHIKNHDFNKLCHIRNIEK